MIIPFKLNGKSISKDIPLHLSALGILTELEENYSKILQCNDVKCGFCTILVNDRPIYSCLLPAFALKNCEIWTLSGIKSQADFIDIENGFIYADANPCPNCTAARYLTCEAMLKHSLYPDDDQIKETIFAVSCSCVPAYRIFNALKNAAKLRSQRYD